MKDIVIIKNSNTLLNNDVYFPDINEIENGELVLNNSTGKETLFVKNDADDIVPFRSKQYTLDKINASIPTVTISETAPDKPKDGDFWIEPIPSMPFILEFNVVLYNQLVTLPISGNVNCEVDWGDGSIETTNRDRPTHIYAPGTYIVKINGEFEKMYNCSTNVTKIISWGNNNLSLINMDDAFTRCINLTEIPSDDYGAFINVTSFVGTFFNCSNLVSIPRNLFSHCYNVVSFKSTFNGCTGLIGEIPKSLFDNCPKVTTFYWTFRNCGGLTSVPDRLFYNNYEVIDFGYTFSGCTGLTAISNDFFGNKPKVTSCNSMFFDCRLLQTIPEGLFDKFPEITDFGYTFSGCTSLTYIPKDFFKYNTKVKTFEGIFCNCKFQTIPEGLFDNCTEVTNFSETFRYCSNLTSFSEHLFANCPNVTSFFRTFYYCSKLIGEIPKNLFVNCKNVTNFNYTFYYCSGLTGRTPTGTDGLELWERAGQPGYPASITGSYCFENCYNLTDFSSVPTGWK